mmetsp:Transcript_136945/g.425484  ORF Transcript_136945/g.425484 Transcript_136945/m.425484 type:complete len:201 (+) Transcript_136945:1820-2422(+)
MLHRAHDSLALHALDERADHAGPQEGIVAGEALEAAAVGSQTQDVDGGPDHNIGTLPLELGAHLLGNPADDILVPGRRQAEEARPSCRGALCARLCRPEAGAAVLHLQGRQAQARQGWGVTCVVPELGRDDVIVRALKQVELLVHVQRCPRLRLSLCGLVLEGEPQHLWVNALACSSESMALRQQGQQQQPQHHPRQRPA